MRMLASLGLLAAVACSSGQPEPSAEAPAVTLQAGQWEMSSLVTKVTPTGNGTPAIKASGQPTVSTVCLGAADVNKPQPAMFVPASGTCAYSTNYMSNGRIAATIACQEPGKAVTSTVEGTFTATSIDATVNTTSYRAAPDDYQAAVKLTGRHVGACTQPQKQLAKK
jgi:hypothetical protein